jgi:hypothetical protein
MGRSRDGRARARLSAEMCPQSVLVWLLVRGGEQHRRELLRRLASDCLCEPSVLRPALFVVAPAGPAAASFPSWVPPRSVPWRLRRPVPQLALPLREARQMNRDRVASMLA